MAQTYQAPSSFTEQDTIRLGKLNALIEQGRNPYEITTYDRTHTSGLIRDQYDALEGKTVRIAGRILGKHIMGKASFARIQDPDGTMQIYVKRDDVGEDAYKDFKALDIGDIIGVEGVVFKTKTGEISVRTSKVTLLSKSLLPLPEKYHGLTNVDARFRQRYVDLMVNPEVKRNFKIRSQFIKHLRSYLDDMDYIEVETPVLNTIAGGAAARRWCSGRGSPPRCSPYRPDSCAGA